MALPPVAPAAVPATATAAAATDTGPTLPVDVAPAASAVALELVRLHPDARLPVAMTGGAAGLDLHACLPAGPCVLSPGERAAIPTGLAIAIPGGYEGQVRPRSGLARSAGVTVLNAPGTIDADYRGELQVLLVNLGSAPCTIASGERIAQLLIAPVVRPDVVEVHALDRTERGTGGFGSTGR